MNIMGVTRGVSSSFSESPPPAAVVALGLRAITSAVSRNLAMHSVFWSHQNVAVATAAPETAAAPPQSSHALGKEKFAWGTSSCDLREYDPKCFAIIAARAKRKDTA